MYEEIEPDWSHYLKLAIWNTHQAACLLCHLNPELWLTTFRAANIRDEFQRRKTEADKIRQVLEAAIENTELSAINRFQTADQTTLQLVHKLRATEAIQCAEKKTYEIPLQLKTLLDHDQPSDEVSALLTKVKELEVEIMKMKDNPFAFDSDDEFYAEELDFAVIAWMGIRKAGDTTISYKRIAIWLENHFPDLTAAQYQRIATVINPNKSGGRPHSKD